MHYKEFFKQLIDKYVNIGLSIVQYDENTLKLTIIGEHVKIAVYTEDEYIDNYIAAIVEKIYINDSKFFRIRFKFTKSNILEITAPDYYIIFHI